ASWATSSREPSRDGKRLPTSRSSSRWDLPSRTSPPPIWCTAGPCRSRPASSSSSERVPSPRFSFAEFVLSPPQRDVLRRGRPVPLIPKYFDLLVLLVSRRHEAVAKQIIFTEIWSDVIVSDGALSQAVRTLRRTLGDDSREPRFIRTVSRHGYQFVCQTVE